MDKQYLDKNVYYIICDPNYIIHKYIIIIKMYLFIWKKISWGIQRITYKYLNTIIKLSKYLCLI